MVAEYTSVNPVELLLPHCPIPRPGDRVTWFSGATRRFGSIVGHRIDGRPCVISDQGAPVLLCSYEDIRLEDPLNGVGPNWLQLEKEAEVVRPPKEQLDRFRMLLEQRTPPGPKYVDLITEIWARGFEVFLVGGTVRDVIAGVASKDVDLVTTMPLRMIQPLVRSMYQQNPSTRPTRGYIRVGGTPGSGDPFIDIKLFCDSFLGTPDATFGAAFSHDVQHRDFACNSVYFDPINRVLIDPTGRGIPDARDKVLDLVCKSENPYQQAQIFIRMVKFMCRGFNATSATLKIILEQFAQNVAAMKVEVRIQYFRAQVINKHSREEQSQALSDFKAMLHSTGGTAIWQEHFESYEERLLV